MANRGYSGKRLRCCAVKSICIILMLAASVISNFRFAHAGMTESLTDGLKQAGQMFGINTAADVADLVAKAFSNTAPSEEKKKPDIFSTFFQRFQRQPTTTTKSPESEQEDDLNEEAQQQDKQESLYQHIGNPQLLAGLLRMVGFDARKLGALALNALVMMAQAIGNTLLNVFTRKPPAVSSIEDGGHFMNENGEWITKAEESQEKSQSEKNEMEGQREAGEQSQSDRHYRPRRQVRSGSPVDWFLENPTDEMREQLSQAMDSRLADKILDAIDEYGRANPNRKVDCMKMLMCKASPIIWAMQRSIEKRVKGIGEPDENEHQIIGFGVFNPSILRKQLPSVDELRKRSMVCNERYGKLCQ